MGYFLRRWVPSLQGKGGVVLCWLRLFHYCATSSLNFNNTMWTQTWRGDLFVAQCWSTVIAAAKPHGAGVRSLVNLIIIGLLVEEGSRSSQHHLKAGKCSVIVCWSAVEPGVLLSWENGLNESHCKLNDGLILRGECIRNTTVKYERVLKNLHRNGRLPLSWH